MKRFCLLCFSVLLPFAVLAAEEDRLLDVLKSNASLTHRDAACERLKWIGTERAVPALAELLTDTNLGITARDALESLPYPAAEKALIAALSKTEGSNQAGIAASLGVRRDAMAVPELAKLLAGPDLLVVVTAAESLGKIGGAKAADVLEEAWKESVPGPAHDAVSDGLLACANQLLRKKDIRAANPYFQELYDKETNSQIRLGSFRGLILTSEKLGISMMVNAISGPDKEMQSAALSLASKVGSFATTMALGTLAQKSPEAVQIALLQALGQRKDRNAVMLVGDLLDSSTNPVVRLAAINCLGELRDGRVALLLAYTAEHHPGAERTAARQALTALYLESATDRLKAALPKATAGLQVELIRALGARSDFSAAPEVLRMTQSTNDAVRNQAFQTLAQIGMSAQIGGLVDIIVAGTNDDMTGQAADTLNSICQHVVFMHGHVEPSPIVKALKTAPTPAKVALLPVCSGINDAKIRDAIRVSEEDADPAVQTAAIRAVCDSQDPQLLSDTQMLATGADEKYRLLAFRGLARTLAADQTNLPPAKKIEIVTRLKEQQLNAEEKRLLLSILGGVPDPAALPLAQGMMADADVKVEAADAVVQIAKSISIEHPTEAKAALQSVLKNPPNDDVRKSARQALNQMSPKAAAKK